MTRPRRSLGVTFYSTPPYECSYLPGRTAVTLFADPALTKTQAVHARLSALGFRRSGVHLYRPRCPRCSACVPVRIPVAEFRPSRAQRRCAAMNSDLTVRALEPEFREEHFALYTRYLSIRHPGGGMDHPSPESYMDFLTAGWADTIFYEFRDGRRLVAVAVVDVMTDALSAVYTFFDPQASRRSPGRYAILHQVDEARRRGLSWVYLGYWIGESEKMRYKAEYRPLEHFVDGHWTRPAAFACGPFAAQSRRSPRGADGQA